MIAAAQQVESPRDEGATFVSGMAGQLKTMPAIAAYMNAGNAILTIRSKATGQRFTFRVRASKNGEVSFVSVLTSPDNNDGYQYLGFIRNGVLRLGGKSPISADAPSARAFSWMHMMVAHGNERALEQAEVWHEGRCGRCARRLTVPESIESGIGPECAKRAFH